MFWWLLRRLCELVGVAPDHVFEPVISLREDDGQLSAVRCTQCGYCAYTAKDVEDGPPCVPSAHDWVPVRVFQWEHLVLARKLPQPLQCTRCGAHAVTQGEWERYGCPGRQRYDDSSHDE